MVVREKKLLAILCGIAVMAMLFATLWPFNPFPRNRVSWLPDTNGIRFGGPGLVLSKTPLRADGAESGNSCSLELLLRPASIDVSTTILSFYSPDNPQQFAVRQWTDSLLVTRDLVIAENKMKRTKFDVDHVFQPAKRALLTITSGPNGTVVYSNGSHAQTFSRFTIPKNVLSGQIIVGTSSVDYQPWPGEISGLAIYSKELTAAEVARHYASWIGEREIAPADFDGTIARYAFTERSGNEIYDAVRSAPSLDIPDYFRVPHKVLLKSAVKEFEASRKYVMDVLMNIAGFVPLGFIFCAYFLLTRTRGQAILYATLVGGILSVLIEVLQAYIPQRVSGTTDIITNTLGALLGAILARPNMVRAVLGKTTLIAAGGDSASQ
jgi:VanZ family protein